MGDQGTDDRRAVVLVSGGLDSATALAVAKADGFACHALSFDYTQRHAAELDAATEIAARLGAVEHRIYPLDLSLFTGSALTGVVDVPKDRSEDEMAGGIPVTYVPCRNLIFLTIAAGWAETLGAGDLYIGVNAVDYSGYPDCRPEFIQSFEETLNLATKRGVEAASGGEMGIRLHTPLIDLTKAEIIRLGTEHGVDYARTVSCYDPSPDGLACGRCDSCQIRRKGFLDAGVEDPTRYAERVGDAT
ncbi:MAG: 7-cyano-7-deazaguanine synthase QueC [Phycisphaerae bacterium]|nr:7-cyano-7-deazaguanine synthase QueC [Phycisphaerae bacterium]